MGELLILLVTVEVLEDSGRLVLHSLGLDMGCCIHGIKLRWQCDACIEFIENRTKTGAGND